MSRIAFGDAYILVQTKTGYQIHNDVRKNVNNTKKNRIVTHALCCRSLFQAYFCQISSIQIVQHYCKSEWDDSL